MLEIKMLRLLGIFLIALSAIIAMIGLYLLAVHSFNTGVLA